MIFRLLASRQSMALLRRGKRRLRRQTGQPEGLIVVPHPAREQSLCPGGLQTRVPLRQDRCVHCPGSGQAIRSLVEQLTRENDECRIEPQAASGKTRLEFRGSFSTWLAHQRGFWCRLGSPQPCPQNQGQRLERNLGRQDRLGNEAVSAGFSRLLA